MEPEQCCILCGRDLDDISTEVQELDGLPYEYKECPDCGHLQVL